MGRKRRHMLVSVGRMFPYPILKASASCTQSSTAIATNLLADRLHTQPSHQGCEQVSNADALILTYAVCKARQLLLQSSIPGIPY